MRIKRICNRNVGPTEHIDIEFSLNKDNMPMPVILVGENGTGKSTVISNVVDAFYEMAGIAYKNVREREYESYQYYKIIGRLEINVGHRFMTSFIEFEEDEKENIQYIFKSGEIGYSEFQQETGIKLKNLGIWNDKDNIKDVSASKKDVEQIFEREVFCYFGPDRYEKPQWMGEKYYTVNHSDYEHISVIPKYRGNLNTPISIRDVTGETLNWLLDVIVDSRVDLFNNNGKQGMEEGDIKKAIYLGVTRQNIEKVMSAILGKDVCFGLNVRTTFGSRFSIIDKQSNHTIVPTLDSLSTGQSVLFNMFATIVRYADIKDINRSIYLNEIKGIVVIDEIELHLHTKLQREVLPKLLKLFPKVQFLITTHSPLFLLGMDEEYGKDGYCIYQMPRAEVISSERFSEFQNAYTYMTQTEKFHSEIKAAIRSQIQKTLIVTEGATDWRHLKAALRFFKKQTESSYSDLKIEFLEYNPRSSGKEGLIKLEMSCSQLVTMCREFSKIQQPRKIVFIADADDKDTKKKLEGGEDGYKDWGNNVYSMVLPVPKHRVNTPNICIEHYYYDNDLKTSLIVNGLERRIYMGQEFDEYGISIDRKYMCIDRNSCGQGKINIIDGQSEKRVFRIDDEKRVNYALAKMDFAEAIYYEKEEVRNIDFTEFQLVFDVIRNIEKLNPCNECI